MKKRLLTILSCLAATTTLAHQQTGDDRVDYRQGAYKIMGWHMGILGDMARGETAFDLDRAREAAHHLQWAERLTATTYTPDTKQTKKSRLLPKAWRDMGAFADRGKTLKNEIDALVSDLEAGNEGAAKQRIGEVGKACKACHDDFREKMKH